MPQRGSGDSTLFRRSRCRGGLFEQFPAIGRDEEKLAGRRWFVEGVIDAESDIGRVFGRFYNRQISRRVRTRKNTHLAFARGEPCGSRVIPVKAHSALVPLRKSPKNTVVLVSGITENMALRGIVRRDFGRDAVAHVEGVTGFIRYEFEIDGFCWIPRNFGSRGRDVVDHSRHVAQAIQGQYRAGSHVLVADEVARRNRFARMKRYSHRITIVVVETDIVIGDPPGIEIMRYVAGKSQRKGVFVGDDSAIFSKKISFSRGAGSAGRGRSYPALGGINAATAFERTHDHGFPDRYGSAIA